MSNPTLKFDRLVRGPETLTSASSLAATPWWGHVTAGSHTVVISTAIVAADSIIRLTSRRLDPGQARLPVFGVTSINPGNAFSIACASENLAATSMQVAWEIVNPS